MQEMSYVFRVATNSHVKINPYIFIIKYEIIKTKSEEKIKDQQIHISEEDQEKDKIMPINKFKKKKKKNLPNITPFALQNSFSSILTSKSIKRVG